jgi:hypothetical protein
MVTLALPLFVSTMGLIRLDPTCTGPKFTAEVMRELSPMAALQNRKTARRVIGQ